MLEGQICRLRAKLRVLGQLTLELFLSDFELLTNFLEALLPFCLALLFDS